MTAPQDPDSRARRSSDRTKAAHEAARSEMEKRNAKVSKAAKAKRQAQERAKSERRRAFDQ
ncbi:MAG: hypothetical protein ACR2NH_08705 [Solirubrobacteraceae bacterium]